MMIQGQRAPLRLEPSFLKNGVSASRLNVGLRDGDRLVGFGHFADLIE